MAEATQISGDDNQGYIAGRDMYLGDQYVVQDTSFFEPSLREVEPPEYPSPPRARDLMLLLLRQRLLILAGPELDEKGRIARHIAWLLREELAREQRTIRIREWYRSSDSQKIEAAFHETEGTLLLLPQIQPHHLGYRLTDLLDFVQTHR
ncbi:MAG TPA: hypothetical protein VHN15_12300, partial [Thermoanaerobaculia bacterium]|nr:hypothetical protein [Thermoanaerobaculia bacterium]